MSSADNTKTVLRLITRLNVGGPARQALLLTHALRPRYETVLAAGAVAEHEGELRDERVAVARVPLVRPVTPRADVGAFRAVRDLLRESQPDLLHTHMAKSGSIGRGAAFTLRRKGPRVVHTYHGHVHEGYFSPTVRKAFLTAERSLARATDILIAVSPQIRDELLALEIGQADQYRVIPLGLDLRAWLEVAGPDRSLRRSIGVSEDATLIGAVGRVVPIKNLEMLVDAVTRLPDVHAAIVGDGESRQLLKSYTDRAGVADRVHFVGWWPDVPGAMADLDVVVLTSRNEGTPVALIEALAARRPVVATDVGGVRFVVEDGVTGLLSAPDDPAAFAERLDWALRHRKEMKAMALEGSQQVRTRFASDRLVSDIRDLYDELLA